MPNFQDESLIFIILDWGEESSTKLIHRDCAVVSRFDLTLLQIFGVVFDYVSCPC